MLTRGAKNYGAAQADSDAPDDGSSRVSADVCAVGGPTERAKLVRQESRREMSQPNCRDCFLLICCWPCLLGFCCLHCCENMCGCTCDDDDCSCVRNSEAGTDGDEVDERTPLPVGGRETSLTLACCRGKATADDLDQLVQRGANVNERNSRGDSPLIIAASRERADLVRSLLKSGADPNARDVHGFTVLMRASESGSVDVTNALLDAGADPTVKLADGTTALQVAGSAQQWRVVDTLLSALVAHHQQPFMDSVLRSTLKKARRMGLERLCAKIVETGLPLNGQDRHGYTPLMFAAREGLSGIVEAMLRNGASVSCQARFEGDTALSLACGHSYHFPHHYTKTVELLINAGADVNQASGTSGMTPLAYAVHASNDNIVSLLLKHSADPNLTDKAGWTPLLRVFSPQTGQSLHPAVQAKLTIALLRGGARVNEQGQSGRTALQLAISKQAHSAGTSSLVVDIILRAGAKPWTASRLSKPAVELANKSLALSLSERLKRWPLPLSLLCANAVRTQLRLPTTKSASSLPVKVTLQQAVMNAFCEGDDIQKRLREAELAAEEAKDNLVEIYREQLEAQQAADSNNH